MLLARVEKFQIFIPVRWVVREARDIDEGDLFEVLPEDGRPTCTPSRSSTVKTPSRAWPDRCSAASTGGT